MFQTLSCFQSEKFSASESGDNSSSIQSFSSRILRGASIQPAEGFIIQQKHQATVTYHKLKKIQRT